MKKRKLPVCLFFGSLFIVLGFFFLKNMETIQAKPDDGNPIVIDKGTVDEFSLPFDAQALLEPELLLESPLYDDYFQEDKKHSLLYNTFSNDQQAKNTLWSSEIKNEIVNTFVTSSGNIISLQHFTTSPYGEEYNEISAYKIILQSPLGEVLDSRWVKGIPDSLPNTILDQNAYNGSMLQRPDDRFLVYYTNVDEPTIHLDGEGNGYYFELQEEVYGEKDNKLELVSIDFPKLRPLVWTPSKAEQPMVTHVEFPNGKLVSFGKSFIYDTTYSYFGSMYTETELYSRVLVMAYSPHVYETSIIKNDSFLFYDDPSSPDNTGFIAIEEQKRSDGIYHTIRSWRYSEHDVLGEPQYWMYNSTRGSVAGNDIISFKDKRVTFEKEISDKSTYYFQVTDDSEDNAELYKMDTADWTVEKVKEFPSHTNIRFNKLSDDTAIGFVGQIENFTGVFQGIVTGSGVYSGTMDAKFNVISSRKADLKFITDEPGEVILNNYIFNETTNNYVLSGYISKEEDSFINKVIYNNYPGEATGVENQWVEQNKSPQKGNGFVSLVSVMDDWSPTIKAPSSFTLDLSDPDIVKEDQAIIDNWLLTGSKNGTLDDAGAVKVFDYFDQKIRLNSYSQSWINKRINRNPLNLANPIDWEALGLNLESVGPQQITYFISDSANQVTTTSQWINKKDDFTALDDDHALYAKNFSVPLASVQTDLASIDEVKKRAETKAWNLTNFEIKEDGTKNLFSDRVIIDETQLSSLQQAKDAKPYPLDVTYQTENGKITRRIWVFVTAESTTVDTENNIVLYANDYRYPLDQAPTTTVEKQLRAQWDNTEPAVKAYEYNAIQETGQTLIPLSDGALEGTSGGLGMEQQDLERIQEATEPSVLADIHFTYTIGEKKVSVAVDVTLYHAQTSVVVKFEDTDQTVIHPQVTIEGNVNSQIDLTSKEVVTDALSEIVAEGYLLKERPENETKIILTAEKKEVTYIFEGQLQFIHVTDSLKLTKGKILPFAQTLKYDNPAEDFTVQVKDTRSYKNQAEKTRGTFKVNVSLTKEFESIDGKKLSEAALLYKNQEITDSGLDVTQSKQNPLNPEEKDFSFLLNQKGTGTEGFTLEVPAGIAQTKAYYAEMTWDLIEGP